MTIPIEVLEGNELVVAVVGNGAPIDLAVDLSAELRHELQSEKG